MHSFPLSKLTRLDVKRLRQYISKPRPGSGMVSALLFPRASFVPRRGFTRVHYTFQGFHDANVRVNTHATVPKHTNAHREKPH